MGRLGEGVYLTSNWKLAESYAKPNGAVLVVKARLVTGPGKLAALWRNGQGPDKQGWWNGHFDSVYANHERTNQWDKDHERPEKSREFVIRNSDLIKEIKVKEI